MMNKEMNYLVKFLIESGKNNQFGRVLSVRSDEIAAIVQGQCERSMMYRGEFLTYGILFLKGNPNPFYLKVPYEEAVATWQKTCLLLTEQ